MSDKSSSDELVWLYRLRQAEFFDAEMPCGWFSDPRHSNRVAFDYCPFECEFCDVQAYADGRPRHPSQAETPGL